MKMNFLKPITMIAVVAVTMFSCAGTNETTGTADVNTTTDAQADVAVGVITTEEQPVATDPVANTDVEYNDMFEDVDNTEQYDVLALARMSPNLSTFVRLVDMSGLGASLQAAGPVTLFAPTNAAFEALPQDKLQSLTDVNNRGELVKLLQLHVLPQISYVQQFSEISFIDRAEGEDIPVSTEAQGTVVYVGGAQIVKGNVKASNGMLHVVNGIVDTAEAAGADID